MVGLCRNDIAWITTYYLSKLRKNVVKKSLSWHGTHNEPIPSSKVQFYSQQAKPFA